MVTHSSTSRPVQCLCMAERTECLDLTPNPTGDAEFDPLARDLRSRCQGTALPAIPESDAFPLWLGGLRTGRAITALINMLPTLELAATMALEAEVSRVYISLTFQS